MSSNLDRSLRTPPKDQNRDSKLHLESIWGDLRSRTQERTNSPDDTGKDAKQSLAMEDTPALCGGSLLKDGGKYVKEYTPFAGPRHCQDQQINRIKHESPWKAYKSGYDLKLDQFVTVAVRKAPRAGKVAIREFVSQDVDRKLEMLWSVRHERFVNLLEIFEVGETYYAVFEHIFVTLAQVVNCPAYPTERQLAAIIGQIVEGLSYLSSKGLRHGSLACSNVLLKPNGEIKLANQECCHNANGRDHSDVRALGYIAMQLMQKYAKDDGTIGIDNLNRWSESSEPVKFLLMTNTATSIQELMQHAFLKLPWRKEELELLQELASFCRRAYKYHE